MLFFFLDGKISGSRQINVENVRGWFVDSLFGGVQLESCTRLDTAYQLTFYIMAQYHSSSLSLSFFLNLLLII